MAYSFSGPVLAIVGLLLLQSVFATIDATCYNVGIVSGCSGCEQGTNGLCHYVSQRIRTFIATTTVYGCYSAQKSQQLVNSNLGYSYAASVCASPISETTFNSNTATGAGASSKRSLQDILAGNTVGAKKASTVYSKKVKKDKVEFQDGSQTIDRTSSTQPLGGLQEGALDRKRRLQASADYKKLKGEEYKLLGLPEDFEAGNLGLQEGSQSKKRFVSEELEINYAPLTCQNFNSARLHTLVETFHGCSVGVASSAGIGVSQRECIIAVNRIWSAFLCPRYGRAISGFRQSLVGRLARNCEVAGCTPTWPWNYYTHALNLVVDDDTPHGIDEIGDEAVEELTGIFEYVYDLVPSVELPVPKPGLEVIIAQPLSWLGRWVGNELAFAQYILTDPILPKLTYRNIVPLINFCDPFAPGCGNAGEIPLSLLGANSSVVQITGFIWANETRDYSLTVNGNAWIHVTFGVATNNVYFSSFYNTWTVSLVTGWNPIVAYYWNDAYWLLPLFMKLDGYVVGDPIHVPTSCFSDAETLAQPDILPY